MYVWDNKCNSMQLFVSRNYFKIIGSKKRLYSNLSPFKSQNSIHIIVFMLFFLIFSNVVSKVGVDG